MALELIDSFDHYNVQADMLTKYPSPGNVNLLGGFTTGRRGGQAISMGHVTGSIVQHYSSAGSDTVVAQFAMSAAGGGANADGRFFEIGDLTVIHVAICCDNIGTIKAQRGGSGGTVIGSSSAAAYSFVAGFQYIEVKIVIHDTAGVVIVRIDGNTVLNLSGVDTRNGGTATWTYARLYSGPNAPVLFDDYILMNGNTGPGATPFNAFLGDMRIDAHYPNGAGNSAMSTTTGSSSRWLNVDDKITDGTCPNSSDYNTVTAVNDKDTLALEDLKNAGATPLAIQVTEYVKKSDTGVCKVRPVVRQGTTDYDGTERSPGTTFGYAVREVYPQAPDGTDWTEAAFNGLEVGYKRTL